MTPALAANIALPPVAIDATIERAIRDRAWFVFSLSGGKDSGATAATVSALLDSIGHPRSRRLAIHADLGRAEWRTTPSTVEAVSRHLGLPLIVVRRRAGDMVDRWEQRFRDGCRRYADLLTYNLIGPWSSSALRFCSSELKANVIGPELARRLRGETVVQVIGIRRDESSARQLTPVSKLDIRFAPSGNAAGTRMMLWHPLIDWTAQDVFAAHEQYHVPLHEAYARGSTRLSCAFCVLASLPDLTIAANVQDNLSLYHHLVGLEAHSTFSFQPARWLADVAPDHLPETLKRDIDQARCDAGRRRSLEASLPKGLRFVKGWPPRLPTWDEAVRIAEVRAELLYRHALQHRYPTATMIRDRFAALIEERDLKRAA
ncbi:hypothetical protein Sj15T_09890 [Sphingobium sp. TA15]|uniref:Phosphoadenosine phosphosulphate reductase domain-containing protein n=1 Tax=Sphingobium indicum (strain DSM 16413 / CCM 7287 / MTCC 6362 / UT26 / NBRC 101211 / UT26S) TaxID=452662 RepID=D4Z8Q9_SPHIU|nr:phosphoadenosine phosphosulfate reductase family protein [Sphingobium indicum]BAI98991.1 conserved hypothetical protein [Sphingobium indicum UT26S]BDD65968.1 hypothetical protein Sj15T_09890 [Sphingobium sp. TA15]